MTWAQRGGMRFCRASKVGKCVMFARSSAGDGIRVDAKQNPRGRGMHSIMQDTRITRRRYSSRVSATKSVSIDCGYCENYHSLPPLLRPPKLTGEQSCLQINSINFSRPTWKFLLLSFLKISILF